MANVQTAGIVALSVDGLFIDVASDLTYQVNTFSREGLVGQSGPQGYRTTPVYAELSCQVRDTGNVNPTLFALMTNVTVVAQLANGRVVTAVDAFVEDVQKINTVESTFEVKFKSSNLVVF